MPNNGLILMGLEFSQQLIARGAIIMLAVALSKKKDVNYGSCYYYRNSYGET